MSLTYTGAEVRAVREELNCSLMEAKHIVEKRVLINEILLADDLSKLQALLVIMIAKFL